MVEYLPDEFTVTFLLVGCIICDLLTWTAAEVSFPTAPLAMEGIFMPC